MENLKNLVATLGLLILCGCREMFMPPVRPSAPYGPEAWCDISHLSESGQPLKRFERGYLVRSGAESTLRFGVAATRIYVPASAVVVEKIDYDERLWAISNESLVSGFFHCQVGNKYEWNLSIDYGFGDPRRGRFFNTQRGMRELSFSSSDESILSIRRASDVADEILFKRVGQASLVVMLDGSEVARVPFDVVASPVFTGMTNTELVKTLGFPSSEEKNIVEWPRSGELNRERVEPTAAEGGTRIVHARFASYPELVVSLDDAGAVKGWHSLSPR